MYFYQTYIQPLAEGNQGWEPAHAGAGQGSLHSLWPLQNQREAGLRDFGVAAGLRSAAAQLTGLDVGGILMREGRWVRVPDLLHQLDC